MAETELTQAVYEAVLHERPSAVPGPRHPVDSVSWEDCQTFLERLRRDHQLPARLPTEAEWEYACRAGRAKAMGEREAWCGDNSTTTQDVANLAANAWGLYDMLGNVMEWCQDDYAPLGPGLSRNPSVSLAGRVHRVARGGAWCSPPSQCRPAARAKYLPVDRLFFLGLRIAVDDQPGAGAPAP